MTRFYVQDQGIFIPTNDLAQAFAALNFVQKNSLGVGTDTLIPIVNNDNPNWIADIQTQDFWGYTGTGNSASIYRLTNVGIGTSFLIERFQVGSSGTDLVVTRSGLVGIGLSDPSYKLDVAGNHHVSGAVKFDSTLDVDGNTKIFSLTTSSSTDTGALVVDGGVGIGSSLNIGGNTRIFSITTSSSKNTGALVVEGGVGIEDDLNIGGNTRIFAITASSSKDTGALVVEGGVGIESNLNVGNNAKILSFTPSLDKDTGALVVNGGVGIGSNLNVGGSATVLSTTNSTTKDTGALVVEGGVGIEKNLNVGNNARIYGTLELDSSIIDVNNSTASGKFDYRLSAVGTGVSWRPPGVQTQNAIWVTMDGDDSNSGLLEGDAKRTIGAAAAVAQEGDTIFIRSGVYVENNPIGLRTDVSVSGQDLRLVTVIPNNPNKDVFHVRRGCLIENLSFAGSSISVNHSGCGAVAFPPTSPSNYAVSGYIASGPANEGSSGRWKSPYVRNCTNFMTGSIGMKINGDHASGDFTGSNVIGADLKSMVCDSFTQYNENGIGVSITNNGYAQLVSIFTINCDVGIYCDSGGSCDLTNSNSSFGNYGLKAVGLGRTEFTGYVNPVPQNFGPEITRIENGVNADSDKVQLMNIRDSFSNIRRPYDGQALFFEISNLDGRYSDAVAFSTITSPMIKVQEIKVTSGGSGYSAASPPNVYIYDHSDPNESQQPKGPQGIVAELSPTIDASGAIIAIDVVNSGRNYLPTQDLRVKIDGNNGTVAEVVTQPIYYTIDVATSPTPAGLTTVTFNERIPYELFGNENVSLKRISRILTSSHSFEYIGTGTSINSSTPFQGAVPIKENEIVALDGAQIPFTSTDQKGNFDIGEGLQINQPTGTIRGRDFSRALQAEVTPLILALR